MALEFAFFTPRREGQPAVHSKEFNSRGMILEMNLSAIVKKRALEAGFDLVGIAPASAWCDLEFSRRWVEAGYGGEMSYLANPKREDPRRILPSVQSIICVGLIYNARLPYSTEIKEATGRGQPANRAPQTPESIGSGSSPSGYGNSCLRGYRAGCRARLCEIFGDWLDGKKYLPDQ